MTNKKSIFLALPENVGLSDLIAKNFEYHGFDVIYYQREPYKYKKLTERAANFFRKNLLADRSYKKKQQDKVVLEKLQFEIKKRGGIDYALFIRPDTFSIDFIEQVKSNVDKIIGYQWDGLNVFPDVFDSIELFDEFYVFDPKDIVNHPEYNLKLSTNFYFDMDKNPVLINSKVGKTIYFIGTHLPQRVYAINNFIKAANHLDVQINFLIRLSLKKIENRTLYNSKDVQFIDKDIEYSKNLEKAKNSEILVDFVNNAHSGLSFRIFESIFYQKKLITNNAEVANYDLYHKNNIYILDGDDIDINSLRDFLDKPYYDLPSEVLDKYSFKTWYSLMLGFG